MVNKFLNPLLISIMVLVLALGLGAFLMYGNCQTSKWHYMTQCFWMPTNLPSWMLKLERPKKLGIIVPKNYKGIWKAWYRNGKKFLVGNYVNGRPDGQQRYWHANGKKRFVYSIVNGKEHGKFEYWYANGCRAYVYCYDKGVKVGKHELWYENGRKMSVAQYENGFMVSSKHWNEKGESTNRIDR